MSSEPHSVLLPLFAEHDISYEVFRKKRRPPLGIREKRAAIVTCLHQQGYSWSEMISVTGLSQGAIQRLTQAKGCAAVQEKLRLLGTEVGKSWKSRKRPGQLERQWETGVFDHLRGRKRPVWERECLKDSWTPERRDAQAVRSSETVWGVEEVRNRILAFHRSPEERARRSRLQTQRMQENPVKYLRGKGGWVETPKGDKDQVFVRSSYERAAISLLEEDPLVISYQFEPRFVLLNGKWILPDFLVLPNQPPHILIEVKASWVLKQAPDTKVQQRLRAAQSVASERGWSFEVWTEEELADAL